MRRIALLVLPLTMFAACEDVGPEPTTLRSPALGPPSFQMSNTGVTITDLGPPDGSGLAGQGLSVNEAGHVVGTILDFGTGVGAFLWADGVMTRIDNIEPSAINDDGLIAGGCSSHACLWNNGVTTDLGTLGGDASMARDLNNAGQVVGISKTSAGEWHGFLWADGVMTDLGSIEPRAINERGQIAGFCPAFGFPMRACLWENGVITELGTLGGAWSRAFDINNVGQVVGISLTSTGQTHGFLWANGVMTDLGHLGRDHSEARAINDAGQVVGFGCIDGCEAWHGGLSNTGTVWHGFLWTNGVMTDLGTLGGHQNRPDWSIPEDINEAGLIAGSSYTGVALDDDDATGHAVVWTPGPGNTAPAVSAGPDQQVGVGQAVSLTFTFPDATPEGPWTWYVAWGDYPDANSEFMATTAGTATTPNEPITVAHTYAVEGQYTVNVRVTDGNGGVGLDNVIVTVNTAPTPATMSHTVLTAGTNTVNQKVYATAAVAPAPNTLVTVAVLEHSSLGTPPRPTLSGGGMTAWDVVATTTFDTGALPSRRLTIFRAMSPTPGSGAITITSNMTLSHCQWIVSQWAGVETGGMNGAGAIRQTGSARGTAVSGLTVPLAAFGHPNNVGYGVFGVRSSVLAVTPGAGFTGISEQPSGEGTPGDLEAEWATNRTTIAATWTKLNGGALGVEIKVGGTGLPVPDASRSTVSAAPISITAGTGSSAITVTVKDAGGNPMSGVWVVLSATGSGNTLTQPAGLTDAAGVARGTLSSTVAGTKTVSATADGTALTQRATVTVTAPPVSGTITQTLLTAGNNTLNQRVYVTGAIAPAPNTLVTVAVLAHSSLGTPPSPTLSGGGMTAWEIVATTTFDTGTLPSRRLTIFRAMSTAPGSGPLTITSSMTLSHCQWIVSQWSGVQTGGVNGAGAIGQTGSTSGDGVSGLTVSLAAFANPNNVAYGVFGVRSSVFAVAPGAGFTEISEQPSGEGTPGDLEAEWAVNRNTINATWINLNAGALGVEIKAAAFDSRLTFAVVSAGGLHRCGVTTTGAAYCWGDNSSGQLGDGTTTFRTSPTAVVGGLTFATVSAGWAHTCGVTTSGAAYCWGGGQNGQLGGGTLTLPRGEPAAVVGGLTFAAVSAGVGHTCGVTTSGAAYCWGGGGANPTAVAGGLTFAAVSAGSGHTCGLTPAGAVYCWGDNQYGQLGVGDVTTRTSPVAVVGGLTFAAVSAGGAHTCGVTASGAAYCWGSNSEGELGDGTLIFSQTSPVAVVGGLTFAAISAGDRHTCGVTPAGAAYCWGLNLNGQLGDGTITELTRSPVAVVGGLTFAAVTAGAYHSCGLTPAGAAYCWGPEPAPVLSPGR